MTDERKLRVLVVDDSAYNRQTITAMLESLPEVEVVGRAMNGKEALKLAFDLEPDVITLDLEMPEMDGFSFMRLLMTRRATPVIVVSGYAQRENVFRALELGALDFIAKPSREISPDLKTIERELAFKVGLVRKLQSVRLRDRARSLAASGGLPDYSGPIRIAPPSSAEQLSGPPPIGVVGIAASTGGPPAIQQLLCSLPATLPISLLIAQHMPARFTRAFAERLDRLVGFSVVEAKDGQPLCASAVYIAPGAANIEVEVSPTHGRPIIRVVPPARTRGGTGVALTPCADHLFKSAVAVYKNRFCALVLTGMGSDGREGSRAAREAGAAVVVEDPATAVMPGMPYSVIEAGIASDVLPLEEIPAALVQFARQCAPR